MDRCRKECVLSSACTTAISNETSNLGESELWSRQAFERGLGDTESMAGAAEALSTSGIADTASEISRQRIAAVRDAQTQLIEACTRGPVRERTRKRCTSPQAETVVRTVFDGNPGLMNKIAKTTPPSA